MTGSGQQRLPDGVYERQQIHDGRRYWLTGQRRYSEPSPFRANLVTAIAEMVWYPPVGAALPMWPGLGLAELLHHTQFELVAGLGVSPTPLEYPEDPQLDDWLERAKRPNWATYGLLGVMELTAEGWQLSYFLDRGLDITGVAIDYVRQDRPRDMSVLCALNRHDECPGVFRRRQLTDTAQIPCRCGCGCRTRSQRRSDGDAADHLAEEFDDLDPDSEGRTVTHNKPPESE